MKSLQNLLEFNRSWAERVRYQQPEFFEDLSKGQHPNYLWIGCSDSRVPETQIVKQHPGDIFVHRNIANLVLHSDMNSQAVLQYAVQVLKVEHVIVCVVFLKSHRLIQFNGHCFILCGLFVFMTCVFIIIMNSIWFWSNKAQ